MPSPSRHASRSRPQLNEQEIGFIEAALSITTDASEEGELLRRAGSAASEGGRHELADGFLTRAEARYRGLGDRPAIAGAIALRGEAFLNWAQLERGIELLKAGAAEFEDLDDEALVPLWSQLARAYFFAGDADAAILWADRTLAAAERLDRSSVVADALVTKGTTLVEVGRAIEGSALIEAGKRLAEATGLRFVVARAYQNLSYAMANIDSGAALENAKAGFAHAQRFGMAGLAAAVAVNVAQESIRHGRWGEARSAVDAALEIASDPIDRAGILIYRALLDALQGRPFAEILAQSKEASERQSDPQIRSELHLTEALIALVEDRLADAVTLGKQAATELPQNAPAALRLAGRGASWMRDAQAAREALSRLESVPIHGPQMDASRAAMRAGVAALEGRADEAIALFREALRLWNELGLEWEYALTALDMVLLVGVTDHEGRAAIEAARATFSRLDAKPFLSRMEEASTAATAAEGSAKASLPSASASG
jgi:tetratricopeptide (TPR) repeat protein